jgi:replication-associated recombination protein RarA
MILCQRAKKRMQNFGALRQYKYDPESVKAGDTIVNEVYFKNLMKRTRNYADITQKQNEFTMRELLKKHNNYCPDVILDITVDAELNGQVY